MHCYIIHLLLTKNKKRNSSTVYTLPSPTGSAQQQPIPFPSSSLTHARALLVLAWPLGPVRATAPSPLPVGPAQASSTVQQQPTLHLLSLTDARGPCVSIVFYIRQSTEIPPRHTPCRLHPQPVALASCPCCPRGRAAFAPRRNCVRRGHRLSPLSNSAATLSPPWIPSSSSTSPLSSRLKISGSHRRFFSANRLSPAINSSPRPPRSPQRGKPRSSPRSPSRSPSPGPPLPLSLSSFLLPHSLFSFFPPLLCSLFWSEPRCCSRHVTSQDAATAGGAPAAPSLCPLAAVTAHDGAEPARLRQVTSPLLCFLLRAEPPLPPPLLRFPLSSALATRPQEQHRRRVGSTGALLSLLLPLSPSLCFPPTRSLVDRGNGDGDDDQRAHPKASDACAARPHHGSQRG